ncbi:MAG: preprotein translocase subunit YajC [Oscillospiraceae bacterium]|nr:preprotein translocase subunit YajC [Oscillospiraceae bacterium]
MRAENTASDTNAAGMSPTGQLLYYLVSFGLVALVIYLFMIRPQSKKEKEAKKLRDNLQIGDEVTTIGGIVGIVVRKNEETGTVVIETGGDRSKIRVKLWAISENATVHDAPEEAISKK